MKLEFFWRINEHIQQLQLIIEVDWQTLFMARCGFV